LKCHKHLILIVFQITLLKLHLVKLPFIRIFSSTSISNL
jgi:hypothetical protein